MFTNNLLFPGIRAEYEATLWQKRVLIRSLMILLGSSGIALVLVGRMVAPLTGAGGSVERVPGSRIISAFRFLLPKKTFDRVVEPTYADFWEEYVEALSQGQKWKAWWIHVRFYLILVLVLAQQAVSTSLYKVFEDVLERVGKSVR
ncbi:MAG: hypothetical protein ACR2GR_03930 [Rhodothermales bacterium]